MPETVLCTISLALFPPSRQESHHTRWRLYAYVIEFAAKHCHQVAGNGQGPFLKCFMLLAVGEGIAEAGVIVGSKGKLVRHIVAAFGSGPTLLLFLMSRHQINNLFIRPYKRKSRSDVVLKQIHIASTYCLCQILFSYISVHL